MSNTKQIPLLVETIKIDEGVIYNLSYHQKRCDSSRQSLFKSKNSLDLSSVIKAPPSGQYKCRVLYENTLHSIEYIPYQEKEISSLKIIPSNIIYDFKYAQRKALNELLERLPSTYEVIIEKEGFLTDTTISNIAFYDGHVWLTPKKPLLKGTMRQKLLDDGLLITKNITRWDLNGYTQVALINAMIGFKILKNIHPKELEGVNNDY